MPKGLLGTFHTPCFLPDLQVGPLSGLMFLAEVVLTVTMCLLGVVLTVQMLLTDLLIY